ncbi:MAG: 30S ribosomal protein S20 [Candidatus Paceibacterota bacterium]
MPITSSAKKALRNSDKKRVFNIRRKKAVEVAVKELKGLIKEGKKSELTKVFSKIQKALDKASKGHTLSKNTVSRKKSRISQLIKKAQS